jgi:hypothetical protein
VQKGLIRVAKGRIEAGGAGRQINVKDRPMTHFGVGVQRSLRFFEQAEDDA